MDDLEKVGENEHEEVGGDITLEEKILMVLKN